MGKDMLPSQLEAAGRRGQKPATRARCASAKSAAQVWHRRHESEGYRSIQPPQHFASQRLSTIARCKAARIAPARHSADYIAANKSGTARLRKRRAIWPRSGAKQSECSKLRQK